MINNLVSGSNMAFERLEPCAGKFACTVLRGVSSSNTAYLLDLTLVKQFIGELKGKIDVSSCEGKGTTFTVQVPVT